MHKDFYASGFLYHPKTQQILLQQPNTASTETEWSLFEGECLVKETAGEAFKRIIYSHLHLELKPKSIFPIYSYFHEGKGKNNFLHYAIVRKLEKFPDSKKAPYRKRGLREERKFREVGRSAPAAKDRPLNVK